MRAIFLLCLTSIFSFVHSYEVFTISDSIVDYILKVEEEFVDSLPGLKGGSELVDDVIFERIIRASGIQPIIRPGSSGVNIIKGLQHLGHSCGIMTTVGDDEDGRFFLKSIKNQGITLQLQTSSMPTGKSACLVTPNGERTMRTFLGAAAENDHLLLRPKMFQNISHFHLEGYQLKHNNLSGQAVALAKKNHATISLDLSSFEVVKANRNYIWSLLEGGQIDILFANQDEARVLTGLPPKEAADLLVVYCPIAVVTIGEKGSIISYRSGQLKCPAYKVNAVDTTGAGDLFISGFLHGYLNDKPLLTCAEWGSLLASVVIQSFGTEIPDEQWDVIKKNLSKTTHQEQ